MSITLPDRGALLRGVTCEPELSVSAHHHSRHRVGIGDICLDRYDVSARRRNFRDGRFRLRLFVAPNNVGAAISRHKRAGRIEERDGKLFSTQS